MATLTVDNETPSGRPVSAVTLPGLPEQITVREIVRLRVREEVARHNADPAVTAFECNGSFILVGDHQVETLDEAVDLTGPDHHVTFVKLTQLVGG